MIIAKIFLCSQSLLLSSCRTLFKESTRVTLLGLFLLPITTLRIVNSIMRIELKTEEEGLRVGIE